MSESLKQFSCYIQNVFRLFIKYYIHFASKAEGVYIRKGVFRPIVCFGPDELEDLTGFHTGNMSREAKSINDEPRESRRPFSGHRSRGFWWAEFVFLLGTCHVIQDGPAEFASHHNYGNHLGHISSKDNQAKRRL